jgi:hypothetical protein
VFAALYGAILGSKEKAFFLPLIVEVGWGLLRLDIFFTQKGLRHPCCRVTLSM